MTGPEGFSGTAAGALGAGEDLLKLRVLPELGSLIKRAFEVFVGLTKLLAADGACEPETGVCDCGGACAMDGVDGGARGVDLGGVVLAGGHVLAAVGAHASELDFMATGLLDVGDEGGAGEDLVEADMEGGEGAGDLSLKVAEVGALALDVLAAVGVPLEVGEAVLVGEQGRILVDGVAGAVEEFSDGDGVREGDGGVEAHLGRLHMLWALHVTRPTRAGT